MSTGQYEREVCNASFWLMIDVPEDNPWFGCQLDMNHEGPHSVQVEDCALMFEGVIVDEHKTVTLDWS